MTSDFVISTRRVRRGQFIAEPGKSLFLLRPEDQIPTPDHAVSKRRWVDMVLKEAESGDVSPAGEPLGDILVFIHGYNNGLDTVMQRHDLLQTGLRKHGYEGAIVSFDWPSEESAINYLEDRSDAKTTALQLVTDCILLFSKYQQQDCRINVHLLAHSTGAYVIREAFDDADDRPAIASVSWTVSQIALIGADISAKSMAADSPKSASLYRHCVRLTNYQNPYDAVLKLSNIKRIGVAPRVGRVGLPDDIPAKAVNVDCGDHYQQLPDSGFGYSHSWHFTDETFAEDLYHTIRGDTDRQRIPTRRLENGGLVLRSSV